MNGKKRGIKVQLHQPLKPCPFCGKQLELRSGSEIGLSGSDEVERALMFVHPKDNKCILSVLSGDRFLFYVSKEEVCNGQVGLYGLLWNCRKEIKKKQILCGDCKYFSKAHRNADNKFDCRVNFVRQGIDFNSRACKRFIMAKPTERSEQQSGR